MNKECDYDYAAVLTEETHTHTDDGATQIVNNKYSLFCTHCGDVRPMTTVL